MKNIILGSLFGALLLAFGYDYVQQRQQNVMLRNDLQKLEASIGQAGQSYSWLSEPVLEAGDKKYSRAQLLDLLLAKAITGKQ